MGVVYMAGPIDGYDGDTSWRDTVKDYLTARGWAVFDPASAFAVTRLEEFGNPEGIRAINRAAIDVAEIVFAYLLAPSIGTCREIEYARAQGKRVIVVHNKPKVELHDVERAPTVDAGLCRIGEAGLIVD